ncbi:hypothetical protein PFISCL1PPCAC_17610, partial [Pristionchus fissidentatus]
QTPSACVGVSCSVTKIKGSNFETIHIVTISKHFSQLTNVALLEQTIEYGLSSDRSLIPLQATSFYANCISEKCVEHGRILRKTGIKSNKPQVECYEFPNEDVETNMTCTGDFCYYRNQSGGVMRGCYTVDDTLADKKVTVGFYEYFSYFTYLCDNKFCNEDEKTTRDNR